MDISEFLASRLHNQCITNNIFDTPEDIVQWLGAVQAQDFAAAKWAIGLRAKNLDDQQIEAAFHQGKILRTHVMRPTWHFVAPKDVRWLLALTKNRVHRLNKYYYNRSGLDKTILETSAKFIRKLLTGNIYLTRGEIGTRLKEKYGFTQDVTLTISLVLMYAELEGIICSGPRRGKQFTYALLDERVPDENFLDDETSLAELALRYFQSHGPATLQDFVWWSGLTTGDAKKGMELQKRKLCQEKREHTVYWFVAAPVSQKEAKIYLLPNYDEYIVGYTDRQFIFDNKHTPNLDARANPLFQHTILLDGKVIGTWRRELKENSVTVTTNIFESLGRRDATLLRDAIQQFGLYMKKSMKHEDVS